MSPFRDSTPLEKLAGVGVAIVVASFAFQLYLAYSSHQILTVTRAQGASTAKTVSALNTLIQTGRTDGAQQSAEAAKAAMQGLAELHEAEGLIGSEIAEGHVTGGENKALLCSIAGALHDTGSAVVEYCGAAP